MALSCPCVREPACPLKTHLFNSQSRQSRHSQGIEHQRSYYRAETHVRVQDQGTDGVRKELWHGGGCGHERGSCHILGQVQILADALDGGQEIVIAYDRQQDKEINCRKNV